MTTPARNREFKGSKTGRARSRSASSRLYWMARTSGEGVNLEELLRHARAKRRAIDKRDGPGDHRSTGTSQDVHNPHSHAGMAEGETHTHAGDQPGHTHRRYGRGEPGGNGGGGGAPQEAQGAQARRERPGHRGRPA